MSSPTQRSLAKLRKEGWLAEVVEKWIPGANIRRDLWGWCDILCLGLEPVYVGSGRYVVQILAVQTTTKTNMKARINKIRDSDTVATVRKANIAIQVHGWFKKDGRWEVKVEDVS